MQAVLICKAEDSNAPDWEALGISRKEVSEDESVELLDVVLNIDHIAMMTHSDIEVMNEDGTIMNTYYALIAGDWYNFAPKDENIFKELFPEFR